MMDFNTITQTYIDLSTALFIFWVHVVDSCIIDYNIICHLSNSPYILYTSKLSAVSATNLIFYKKPIYPSSVLFYEVTVASLKPT